MALGHRQTRAVVSDGPVACLKCFEEKFHEK